MKRYRWLIGVVASIIIIAMGLIIQVEQDPVDDERVIVDLTLNKFSAPSCFDEAGFTNNIAETTYKEAIDEKFLPGSPCTAEAFKTTTGPLWFLWFER